MKRHVLISGASIAGPALAQRMAEYGWQVTVLERAPELRDEGHNIDIRGAGREVVRLMGIEDEVRAAGTHERGMKFIDDDGRAVAAFPVDETSDTDGPTAELEILRGELSRVLYERTRDVADYRFDTEIDELDDRGDLVHATLSDGSELDADLVVIAEGLRSHTRDKVFPGTNVRELGMYMAFLTIPKDPADDGWWNWHHATRSRGVHLRPDNLGTTRALLSFLTDVRGLEQLDRADQVALLRATFADARWVTPRILDALDADTPLYFDAVGQGVAPVWSKGRIALLGDTAFAASPAGGGSTSLALVGAHILAGELETGSDHRAAFERYETLMRPLVDAAQDNPSYQAANPRTSNGIRLVRTAARVATNPVVRKLGALTHRRGSTPAIEAFELPTYPASSPERVG